jgi:peptidoglycan/xylan/chitin deacetylase (PgdA/CDA1 family)
MQSMPRRDFLQRVAGLAALTGGIGSAVSACSLAPPTPRVADVRHLGDWQLLASPGAQVLSRHDAALDRQVVEIGTASDGSEARFICERSHPVNLSNRVLKLWIKVDAASASDLAYVAVKVGSGLVAFENFAYEEVLATGGPSQAREAYLLSTIKPGEWTPLTLGAASFVGLNLGNTGPVDFEMLEDFELAVAAIPGGRATVSFGGLEVLDGDPRYPHGVVSITFDDGLSSPFRLGLPALAAHQFPATAFVIRDLIGPGTADNGSYLSDGQLRTLAGHGWEIAAHANLIADHNTHLGFVGLSRAALISDVEREVAWLTASGFNGARDIALPQGWFDTEVIRVLKEYGHFQTVRTVDFRTIETLPVADPWRLRARLYDPTVPIGPPSRVGSFQWRVDQISRYGGWLILGFHDMTSRRANAHAAPIVNEGSAILDTDFRALIDHIAQRGVPVRTIRQVWDTHPGQA